MHGVHNKIKFSFKIKKKKKKKKKKKNLGPISRSWAAGFTLSEVQMPLGVKSVFKINF